MGAVRGPPALLPPRHGRHRVVIGHRLATRPRDLAHALVGGDVAAAGSGLRAAVVVHDHQRALTRHEERDLAPDTARRPVTTATLPLSIMREPPGVHRLASPPAAARTATPSSAKR